MANKKNKELQLLLTVFVILNAALLLAKKYLSDKGIDVNVVLAGNLILFLISLFTMMGSLKSIKNSNPHVFVRSVYTGFIVRLFVCAIAAFIYIYMNDGKINKPALFICMAVYVIYSAIEVSSLRKALKQHKNG